MSNIHVSLELVSKTDNSVTYKTVVTTEGYYGTNVDVTPLATYDSHRNGGRVLNYIGWPTRSEWKSSWGQPDWRLWGGYTHSYGNWGSAEGILLTNRRKEWTNTVTLDRGNQRYKDVTVTTGVKSDNAAGTLFPQELQTKTFRTNEIPTQSFSSSTVNVAIDSPSTSGDRYIRISASWKNPDNYYCAKLYDSSTGKELASTPYIATSLNHSILITKDMFQKSYDYTMKLWGKDGACYGTIYSNANYIEPSGFGVSVRTSGT